MKGKLVAILFVIVFVLLIAVVFSLLKDDVSANDISSYRLTSTESDSRIVANMETPTPVQTTAEPMLPLPTPVPTPTPAPTPIPTPVPTPVPTPMPTPINMLLASGKFESTTGTYLDVVAEWKAETAPDNQVNITVTVSSKSYALDYTGFPNTLHISIGDQYENCATNDVRYDGKALTLNELATQTISVPFNPGANTYQLQVVWDFNGAIGSPTMGVVPLQSLECGGTIQLAG